MNIKNIRNGIVGLTAAIVGANAITYTTEIVDLTIGKSAREATPEDLAIYALNDMPNYDNLMDRAAYKLLFSGQDFAINQILSYCEKNGVNIDKAREYAAQHPEIRLKRQELGSNEL